MSSLYQQFRKVAHEFGEQSCLISETEVLSYEQVLNQVHHLGTYLKQHGLNSGDTIAIYADKTPQAVIAFLTSSLLNMTCLTLDLAFPEQLIEEVLDDACVKHVLIDKAFDQLNPHHVHHFDEVFSKQIDVSKQNFHDYEQGDGHWLVYSSGTTGKPKGILISETAIFQSILSRAERAPYQIHDKVACNIYFYWEVFRPLMFGATSYTISDTLLFDVQRYIDYLQEHQITETLWTPSFAEVLLNSLNEQAIQSCNTMKRIWLNGEVVQAKLANKLLTKCPDVACFNLYSISETFDVCLQTVCTQSISTDGFSSIGFPIPGVEILILNDNLQPCQPLERGELYIHSPFLAKGYLNNHDKEKESFVYPLKQDSKKRFFKTKDYGYTTKHSEVYVLGRNDHIVKLRGYNISLLAIESVLKESLPIKQCVVQLGGNDVLNQHLFAALVPDDMNEFQSQFEIAPHTGHSKQLQHLLSDKLPAYAIPNRYHVVHALNMESYSTKLDRKNAFQLKTSEPIQALWEKVLQIPGDLLGDHSHFLELGGNSLQAIQLIHGLNKITNHKLSVEDLELYPTLGSQKKIMTDKPLKKTNVLDDFLVDAQEIIPTKISNEIHLNSLSKASKVFFTGATGFLGAHWLYECINSTSAQYVCLVRASSTKDGLQRVLNVFKKYQLPTNRLSKRLEIVCGHLEKPKLGLSDEKWVELSHQIDWICHSAAFVNLLYSYSQLKPSIVDGMRHILELATSHSKKPIVYISSDAVYPNYSNIDGTKPITENAAKKLSSGYAKAKWVSEQILMKNGRAYQLPYFIARPGNLGPSLKTGIPNALDANRLLLCFMEDNQVLPESLYLELTPVDNFVTHLTSMILEKVDQDIIPYSQAQIVDCKKLNQLLYDDQYQILSHERFSNLCEQSSAPLYALWSLDEIWTSKAYSQSDLNPIQALNQIALVNTLKALTNNE